MENPDDDPPKKQKKTLAERRKEAKKAEQVTRQLMEAEALQEELVREQERAREKEEHQLELKAAQEQHDLEMAMAMSSVPTPTDNPLLMPRVHDASLIETQPSTSTEQKECGSTSMQISYLLDCSGCGGTFEGTKKLKHHLKAKPECLIVWGGDFKSLEKKVKAEFQRKKRKLKRKIKNANNLHSILCKKLKQNDIKRKT